MWRLPLKSNCSSPRLCPNSLVNPFRLKPFLWRLSSQSYSIRFRHSQVGLQGLYHSQWFIFSNMGNHELTIDTLILEQRNWCYYRTLPQWCRILDFIIFLFAILLHLVVNKTDLNLLLELLVTRCILKFNCLKYWLGIPNVTYTHGVWSNALPSNKAIPYRIHNLHFWESRFSVVLILGDLLS